MSRLGEPIRSWWLKAARLDLLARVRTPLGIRVWLLALTLSGVLPVLLFAGIATQRGAAAERKIMLADLEHRTESAADAVARHLQSQRELAVTLANSASALAGDLPAFHAYAKRAMAAGKVGRAVVLAEPRGQMLVNTRRPFGEVLPRAGDMQGVTETLVRKTPHIGNLFKGAVSAIHVVTAWALVVRDGQVTALIGVTIEPQELIEILRQARLPEGWLSTVIDRDGIIVARNRDPETSVGRTATPELRASIAKGQHGALTSVADDGVPVSTAFRRMPDSGWTVAVGVPTHLIEAPTLASQRLMLWLGLASLSVAGGLAFLVGRHMSRLAVTMARAAQAVGDGRKPLAGPMSVRELDAVSGALAAAHGLISAREAVLAEAKRLTALALDAGRMGTWHLDVLANRLEYSDEALTHIGIERQQWGGTPEALEAYLHPDDIERRRRDRHRALAGGEQLVHDYRVRRPDGETRWLFSRGTILRDSSGRAIEAVGVVIDITERKRAEQQQAMLIRELDHRVKNTLARVEAIVLRSREGAATIDDLMDSLMGRLEALTQAHSALSQCGWTGVQLGRLVRQEIEPYANHTNTLVDGPEIVLNSVATQALVLTLHELATNAVKYGALSPRAPNGRISVHWHTDTSGKPGSKLVIDWQENGGSPLGNGAAQGDADRKHAGHGGYGSSVIRDLIPYELKGSTVDLDLATSGVRCHIEIPLTALAMAESDPERDVPRGDSVVGWNCSAANKSVAEQISGAEQVSGLAKGSTQR